MEKGKKVSQSRRGKNFEWETINRGKFVLRNLRNRTLAASSPTCYITGTIALLGLVGSLIFPVRQVLESSFHNVKPTDNLGPQ